MSGRLAWRPAMMRTQVLDIIPTETNIVVASLPIPGGVPLFNKSHVIERPSVKETSLWHPRILAFFPLKIYESDAPSFTSLDHVMCNLRTRADGTDCMKTTCK